MVWFRGKTIGRPCAGRAALWIALCLLGAVSVHAVEYAEWCDDVHTLQLSDVSTYWPTWLDGVGRNDKYREGNELFILPQPLTAAQPVIYLSGSTPWQDKLKSALLCRTLVHVVLGAETPHNRLIANHLIFGRFLYDYLKDGIDFNTIYEMCADALASSALLDRLSECPTSCNICKVIHAFRRKFDGQSVDWPMLNEDDVANDLRSVDYQAKLHAYLHKVEDLFSPGIIVSVNKASHTEILLIHDNGGYLPAGTVVLSRYSMCKSCEPAVVRAAGNNPVWFISRCLYKESYIAGKTNASVKKVIVYSDGNAVPIKDLWTDERGLSARNFLNPNNTTVFSGETWTAELPASGT